MEQILGTFFRLFLTVVMFGIFAFCGIKLGIYLRKKDNDKKNNK